MICPKCAHDANYHPDNSPFEILDFTHVQVQTLWRSNSIASIHHSKVLLKSKSLLFHASNMSSFFSIETIYFHWVSESLRLHLSLFWFVLFCVITNNSARKIVRVCENETQEHCEGLHTGGWSKFVVVVIEDCSCPGCCHQRKLCW